MAKVRALVVTGYGINCEREMALAAELAGAKPQIVHAQQLLHGTVSVSEYQLLCFPGGFSFGDELGAAQAFANRLGRLKQKLHAFVEEGNCILGVCNGFQLLVKLGLLPNFADSAGRQTVSLAFNDSCRFVAKWVSHDVESSACVFTRGLDSLYLPVRHAEGKFVTINDAVAKQLKNSRQIALRYAASAEDNPNGSFDRIAGICDPTGRVFGMMAHPEAAMMMTNHPHWTRMQVEASRQGKALPHWGPGYPLFRNAVSYLEEQ